MSADADFAYATEPITADDEEEILRFFRRSFFRDEPLCSCIGLLENRDTCPAIERYSLKDLDNGYSLKALSGGKIIGVCMNAIVSRADLQEAASKSYPDPKFGKIVDLIDHATRKSDLFGRFPDVERAMYVKILSVDGSWRGRGIGRDLMDKTREFAKERGCGLMYADCTSHFTAMALKRLGFECLYSLKYEDYKVDGEQVFHPRQPHNAMTVYVQRVA